MATNKTCMVVASATKRWWFDAALWLLSYFCAAVSIASFPLAERLSDWGSSVLARHGVKIQVASVLEVEA